VVGGSYAEAGRDPAGRWDELEGGEERRRVNGGEVRFVWGWKDRAALL
jgi:hypothetical protein